MSGTPPDPNALLREKLRDAVAELSAAAGELDRLLEAGTDTLEKSFVSDVVSQSFVRVSNAQVALTELEALVREIPSPDPSP